MTDDVAESLAGNGASMSGVNLGSVTVQSTVGDAQSAESGVMSGRRSQRGIRAPKRGKSRVTNGSALLPSIQDTHPSAAFRRYRDLVVALTADAGGPELCSEARKQIIRAFASCSVLREQSEAKLAVGIEIDVRSHALLCSTLTRLVTRLGIERHQKQVESASEIIARKYPKPPHDEEAT